MVLVCGSRGWTDRSRIVAELSHLPAGTLILHGDAAGADRLAGNVAQNLGFGVWAMPYFSEYGKAGGARRNVAMLAILLAARQHGYLVQVLAFTLGTPGTAHMIAQATKERVRVRTIKPEVPAAAPDRPTDE